ncbi:MAG: leucine-rich repeat protein [Alphaproteobacteria bacterium]|nr:leucine-rich repeat protein [Alphaproteobacteria bacterium]
MAVQFLCGGEVNASALSDILSHRPIQAVFYRYLDTDDCSRLACVNRGARAQVDFYRQSSFRYLTKNVNTLNPTGNEVYALSTRDLRYVEQNLRDCFRESGFILLSRFDALNGLCADKFCLVTSFTDEFDFFLNEEDLLQLHRHFFREGQDVRMELKHILHFLPFHIYVSSPYKNKRIPVNKSLFMQHVRTFEDFNRLVYFDWQDKWLRSVKNESFEIILYEIDVSYRLNLERICRRNNCTLSLIVTKSLLEMNKLKLSNDDLPRGLENLRLIDWDGVVEGVSDDFLSGPFRAYFDHEKYPFSVELVGMKNLTSIGRNCMYNNRRLKSFLCSNMGSLKKIGDDFCGYCLNLSHLNLSGMKSLEYIGKACFYRCENLQYFHPSSWENVGSIGPFFMAQSGIKVFNASWMRNLLCINNGFFVGCYELEAVDLSDMRNVWLIDEEFFFRCAKLKKLNARSLNPKIISGCFLYECTSLEYLDTSSWDRLSCIGTSFLAGCEGLKKINIEGLRDLTHIPRACLHECDGLDVDVSCLTRVNRVDALCHPALQYLTMSCFRRFYHYGYAWLLAW